MRLDHLLSKEHMVGGFSCRSRAALETFALEVVLTGGTLTIRLALMGRLLVQLVFAGGDGVGLLGLV